MLSATHNGYEPFFKADISWNKALVNFDEAQNLLKKSWGDPLTSDDDFSYWVLQSDRRTRFCLSLAREFKEVHLILVGEVKSDA